MAFDNESVPGFFGWALQGKRVLADTAGFFGWSAGRATNLLLGFLPPPGASTVRTPLTITIAYGGNSLIISYDPNFPRLERQLPTNTAITVTISTASPYYEPVSITFVIGTNEVVSKNIQLAFTQASSARISRINYY